MYDLIIVGAGIVGLYLAIEFQKKGNSVLILEKNKEIGKKPCSGLVSDKIFNFLPQNQDFIEKKFEGAQIWIEKNPFYFSGKAWLLNREKLDKFLFEKVLKRNIKTELGKEVIKIKEKKDCVEVILKSGEEIKGRILAGCDGFFSKVAQEINLSKKRKFLLGIITYTQKREENNIDFPELFFSSRFPGFFTWYIPRKDFFEWGIALEPKYKPKERLESFLKERKIKFKDFKIAPIPLFPLKKTTSKRVFLCGDAAGQIKPYTGGGIVYGLICAKIAAKTINPFFPKTELYEKEWRKELMKEIQFGNLIRKCYSLPDFIKKISLFFIKHKGDIDQDKPSTIFKL